MPPLHDLGALFQEVFYDLLRIPQFRKPYYHILPTDLVVPLNEPGQKRLSVVESDVS
jgi:hypothetical protein